MFVKTNKIQHFIYLTPPAGALSTTVSRVPSLTFLTGSWSPSHAHCPCLLFCPHCHPIPCRATRPKLPLSRPWPWRRRAQWRRRRQPNPDRSPDSHTSWHVTRTTSPTIRWNILCWTPVCKKLMQDMFTFEWIINQVHFASTCTVTFFCLSGLKLVCQATHQ